MNMLNCRYHIGLRKCKKKPQWSPKFSEPPIHPIHNSIGISASNYAAKD